MMSWKIFNSKLIFVVVATAIIGSAGFDRVAVAQQKAPMTIQGKYSYSLGYQFGSKVKAIVDSDREYFEMEPFIAAMRDALSANEPAMTKTQMDNILRLTVQALKDKRKTLAQMHSDRGREFRESFANEEGVVKMKSGVLYKILKEGEGAPPTRQDQFEVHFEGRLINGQVFVSSIKAGAPETFSYDSIISGWQEVLPLMTPGSSLDVVVPAALAYGERGLRSQSIEPNSTLRYRIELLRVIPKN